MENNIRDFNSKMLGSVREYISLESVRNDVLQDNLSNFKNVHYGKTMISDDDETSEKYYDRVEEYILSLTKIKNKIILFTVSNFNEMGKNHYQSFIVVKKSLMAINPSRTYKGDSIHNDEATGIVKDIFEDNDFKTIDNPVLKDRHCQSAKHDVFDQTWSLYLQIEFVKKIVKSVEMGKVTAIVLPVKKDYSSKYKILLKFLQNVVKMRREDFNRFIRLESTSFLDLGEGTNKQKVKYKYEQHSLLKEINPCEKFLSFTVDNMW